jgi:hypothetical protein
MQVIARHVAKTTFSPFPASDPELDRAAGCWACKQKTLPEQGSLMGVSFAMVAVTRNQH